QRTRRTGHHCIGDASEIKSLGHPPTLFIGAVQRWASSYIPPGRLTCSGLGADAVWGLGLRGWVEVRPPGEQVAAECNDAEGGDHRAPGGEEEPSGVEEKRIAQGHGG
ncbi:MAG: hypothetical protein WAN76_10485, partial [Candidatus Sulfotelmatobacter sp.]